MMPSAQVEALFGHTRSELLGQLVDWTSWYRIRRARCPPGAVLAPPATRSMGVRLQLAARRKTPSFS